MAAKLCAFVMTVAVLLTREGTKADDLTNLNPDCLPTFCVDAEPIPDSPCNYCPGGRTCVTASGEVITAGYIHTVDGQLCRCRPMTSPFWNIAWCE